ncbi:MAG: hypothetical protein IJ833_05370 [Lachnospiraceae bacterium]|nr:hypothetical protein [Lachnospiraceae bacterium]
MRSKWRELRIALGICAAVGWWGTLYPEFTLLPDTYRVVLSEDELVTNLREPGWITDETLYRSILAADPDKIVYKSKLLEQLQKLFDTNFIRNEDENE